MDFENMYNIKNVELTESEWGSVTASCQHSNNCRSVEQTHNFLSVNSLMPEINPSAQRYLTRFVTGDFDS
jgi:hypothetical protein